MGETLMEATREAFLRNRNTHLAIEQQLIGMYAKRGCAGKMRSFFFYGILRTAFDNLLEYRIRSVFDRNGEFIV